MGIAEVCILGASHVNANGVPLIQAVLPIGDSENDVESFGEIDQYQGVGLSSLPYPKDDNGFAEGVILRNTGNRDAVMIGGRDTRSAQIVGKLKPGDTVLHSTGPEQAAQVQCKESKRQVVLASKDTDGFDILLIIDGTNDKFQITAFGHMLEISKQNGICLTDSTGSAGLQIKDGVSNLFGDVVLVGRIPDPAFKFQLGLPTGSPGGVAALPTIAAPGLSLGR